MASTVLVKNLSRHEMTLAPLTLVYELPPGSYFLVPKDTVTPKIATVALIPDPYERAMYFQMDNVERDLLDSALTMKLREFNLASPSKMILTQTLVKNLKSQNFVHQIRITRQLTELHPAARALLKSFMELLRMRYEALVLPVSYNLLNKAAPLNKNYSSTELVSTCVSDTL